jgi:hypothetical protein
VASLYETGLYSIPYSALPLGLFYVALAFLELHGLVPRWILLLIAALAGLTALLMAVHSLIRLSWARRTYGRHLSMLVRRMFGMFPKLARSRSEAIKIVFHIIFAASGFTLAATHGLSCTFWLSVWFVAIAATASLRAALPPGVVYLASSDPERIDYFSRLGKRVIPGFAALLEVSNAMNPEKNGSFSMLDFYRRLVGLLYDFRTSSEDDWRGVAKQLIETAALVVVDGRDDTPGVEHEVGRIVENRLEVKTVFLSPDGTLPNVLRKLEGQSSDPSRRFSLMTPDQALHEIPSGYGERPGSPRRWRARIAADEERRAARCRRGQLPGQPPVPARESDLPIGERPSRRAAVGLPGFPQRLEAGLRVLGAFPTTEWIHVEPLHRHRDWQVGPAGHP